MIEQELKVLVSPQDLERLFGFFAAKRGATAIQHKFFPRQYYDTDSFDLFSRGLSLRVQYRKGQKGKLGNYEQVTKCEQPVDSHKAPDNLYRREKRDVIPNPQPDVTVIGDPTIKKLFSSISNKSLRPIFNAMVERRYFFLDVKNGKKSGKVEMAFDKGYMTLASDHSHHDICEIEVELKAGSAAVIEKVCKKIKKICPNSKVISQSKSQAGTLLYQRSLKP